MNNNLFTQFFVLFLLFASIPAVACAPSDDAKPDLPSGISMGAQYGTNVEVGQGGLSDVPLFNWPESLNFVHQDLSEQQATEKLTSVAGKGSWLVYRFAQGIHDVPSEGLYFLTLIGYQKEEMVVLPLLWDNGIIQNADVSTGEPIATGQKFKTFSQFGAFHKITMISRINP